MHLVGRGPGFKPHSDFFNGSLHFLFQRKILSNFSRLFAFLMEKKEIPSPPGAGMARSSDEATGAEIEDLKFDICLLT